DRTAIVGAVELVMIGFIKILGSWCLIPEKHALVSHDVHGIDAGEKNIPRHLAGAEFADGPIHHGSRRGAPVHAFDAWILLLEARLDFLHHFALKRAKDRDLPFLTRRFDERLILSCGKTWDHEQQK